MKAYIIKGYRTAVGKAPRGLFRFMRPDDLAAATVKHLVEAIPELDVNRIDDVIVGNATPEAEQGLNIGRMISLMGLNTDKVPGVTVNRYCSSGLETIALATAKINAGMAECIIAGGVESISTTQGNTNMHMYVNEKLAADVPGIYHAMGQTAECVAKRYNVTREAQDEYALSSQQRTAAAQEAGYYDDEIVPMNTVMKLVNKESGEEKDVEVTVDRDDCNRPETTIEGLSSLKPVFDPENGSVTAGNSSQLSDGASVTLVMSEDKAKELGLTPKLYFRGFTVVGCQPDEMGIGPVYSIPKLLKSADLKMEDIDLWELNEAFASQVVYIRDKLGLPSDKLNVNGGSISIGHPFGMTGSRQVGHVARELNRRGGKYGIVTMCVGGGMGATGLFEAYES